MVLREYIQEQLPEPDELIRLLEANKSIFYIKYRTGFALRDIYKVKKAWNNEYRRK